MLRGAVKRRDAANFTLGRTGGFMAAIKDVGLDELGEFDALEKVDAVSGEADVAAFKRRARLHQSQWREKRSIPPGSHPMRRVDDKHFRKHPRILGSRIELDRAYALGENFISTAALEAVRFRLAAKEPHQTLDADRLYSDLLSSMPMCFNLFGDLHADPGLATAAVRAWWPDTPGEVSAVRFEWSPQRATPGRFLGNRSAFDVAFELDLGDGKHGLIGVETKYHENCRAEPSPDPSTRLPRYSEVAQQSGVFVDGATGLVIGTRLQQIGLDHLLALSMPVTEPERWAWVRFVLVHPEANPSYARASNEYRKLLSNQSTFGTATIESLLAAEVVPRSTTEAFAERYLRLASS